MVPHRYFCASFPGPPKHSHFLIPLVETLHLVIRRYCIEGFLLAPKLSEKNSWVDLSLAGGHISASTTREKKGSSYPSRINTPVYVLNMLYWQNTDITKTGREMMVSRQTTVWTTKVYYLLVKCTSHCLRNMPMWLVLCGTEILHLFLGICCSHTRSVNIHPPKHLMLPSLDGSQSTPPSYPQSESDSPDSVSSSSLLLCWVLLAFARLCFRYDLAMDV